MTSQNNKCDITSYISLFEEGGDFATGLLYLFRFLLPLDTNSTSKKI